jgi:hypothetical protein
MRFPSFKKFSKTFAIDAKRYPITQLKIHPAITGRSLPKLLPAFGKRHEI